MTTTSRRTRRPAALGALLISSVLLAGTAQAGVAAASGASAATAPPAGQSRSAATDPALSSAPAVDPDAAKAMAQQKGISVAEAHRRLAGQQALGNRGASLEKTLGARTGGSYLDGNGELVVTTLDPAADATARAAGARPARVDDSSVRLATITRRLDAASAQGGPGSLRSWYVDVPSNTVVVTVAPGATDARTRALLDLAATFGDSIRVERATTASSPRPAEYMVGGYEFVTASGGTCSVGFNTQDSSGRNVVLTAGHCTKQSGTMTRNGYWIGATRSANYPGNDYGTFWNSYPSYWVPSTSVSKYNGTYVTVRGQWNNPPVGATVCKSGRTTYYTCGTITGLNQSVVYRGGLTMYGLVGHNACVQGGDSGGANISAGAYALGVTSGASSVSETDTRCRSKVGLNNISWYQPIAPALTANGLRLLYQP